MRRSPDDPAFNKALRVEVEQTRPNERVVFIDTDNNVREAVYPSEFTSGVLQSVRKRLEDAGVLKGVVHISATTLGALDGHGPRTSVIEYLPSQQHFYLTVQPSRLTWVAEQPAALQATQRLFGKED